MFLLYPCAALQRRGDPGNKLRFGNSILSTEVLSYIGTYHNTSPGITVGWASLYEVEGDYRLC